MQRYKNLVVLLVALLIITAGGTILFRKYFDGNTHEKVKLSQVDLTKANGTSTVPANFPKEIPLQLSEVTESFDMTYPDRGVTVSSITFKTYRNPVEIFDSYTQILSSSGYKVDPAKTNKDKGILYLTKDKNTLNIIIGSPDKFGKRSVQLVYTQNK